LGSGAGSDKSERNQCDENNDWDKNRDPTHGELLSVSSDPAALSRRGDGIITDRLDTSNRPERDAQGRVEEVGTWAELAAPTTLCHAWLQTCVKDVVARRGAEHDAAAGSVTYRVEVLAEAEGPLLPEPIAPSTQTQELGVGHLFVDAKTIGDMAEVVSATMPGIEGVIVAPSYAVGAISEARSVHKMKRQHDKAKRR
jgi:hypothetical protein